MVLPFLPRIGRTRLLPSASAGDPWQAVLRGLFWLDVGRRYCRESIDCTSRHVQAQYAGAGTPLSPSISNFVEDSLDQNHGTLKASLDKIQIKNWKRAKRAALEKELHQLRSRDLHQWRERNAGDLKSARSLKEIDDKYRGYIAVEDIRKVERRQQRRVAQRTSQVDGDGCVIS